MSLTRRNVKDHLAFGHGPHYCLGAPLARMEARIGFGRMLDRFAAIRLAPGHEPESLATPLFRGPRELPIELEPATVDAQEP